MSAPMSARTSTPGRDGLPYRHDNRLRGPMNLLLLALVVGLTAFALATRTGWLLLLMAVACAAGLVFLRLWRPHAGIEIDAGNVAFWRGRRRQAVPLAEIDRVTLRDGPADRGVTIHRHTGDPLDVPRGCLPEPGALAEALKRAGVRVSGGEPEA